MQLICFEELLAVRETTELFRSHVEADEACPDTIASVGLMMPEPNRLCLIPHVHSVHL